MRDLFVLILIGCQILMLIAMVIFLGILKVKGGKKFTYDLGITAIIGIDMLISVIPTSAISIIDYLDHQDFTLLICSGIGLLGGIAILCVHFWIKGVVTGSKETLIFLSESNDPETIDLNNFR